MGCFVDGFWHGVEVVVDPQGVVGVALVGLLGEFFHEGPVAFGGNSGEVLTPALGNEESKFHGSTLLLVGGLAWVSMVVRVAVVAVAVPGVGRHNRDMIVGVSARQMQVAEKPLLDRGVALMARASRGLAQCVVQVVRQRCGQVAGARVVVLVGQGNNGGDALFAAALLARLPMSVTVVLVGERCHGDGLDAVRASQAVVVTPSDGAEVVALCAGVDVVVDGIVGIGARGAVRGLAGDALASWSARTRRDGDPVWVAVDVPSGVDASSGEVADARRTVHADVTVTFGVAKTGLLVAPGALCAGRVQVVDIGVDVGEWDVVSVVGGDLGPGGLWGWLWELPAATDHKYTRGVVGVDAGSAVYPGAGVLAARAAAACGVGMVRYEGDREVAGVVASVAPHVVSARGRVQARVVGSGQEPDDAVAERVRHAMSAGVPTVLDAGALGVLDRSFALSEQMVLTPHAGELAGLLMAFGVEVTRAQVEARPLWAARRAAEVTGATVVLKGVTPVIAGPGVTYVQPIEDARVSRLATAGSGDVLAGVLGAALARLVAVKADAVGATDIAGAVACGVLTHQLAALQGGDGPLTASDLVAHIPAAIAMVCAS